MKKTTKLLLGGGLACLLLLLLSTWYAVRFNDSRLVVPMDFGSYAFQVRDLPMLASLVLTMVYVSVLAVTLFRWAGRQRREAEATNRTRKLSPKLGLLGLLGFFGFAGFWSYAKAGEVSPFVFFTFFGFFGFFYEGKMSGTFMDERFRENALRARLRAAETALSIILLSLILLSQGRPFGNLEYTLIATLMVLSLTMALYIFLSEYLLYRYDQDGQESGD